jgi:hypothetical protein
MNQKTIIVSSILFFALVLGMFVFAYLKKQELMTKEIPSPQDIVKTQAPYADITRVDAKHFFKDNRHTVVGELTFPTPCDLLEGASSVEKTAPEKVVLHFNVINNADACAQVVTTQRFKIEARASAEAMFTADFMGRQIELNLIPAQPGETPEEFELFIKG